MKPRLFIYSFDLCNRSLRVSRGSPQPVMRSFSHGRAGVSLILVALLLSSPSFSLILPDANALFDLCRAFFPSGVGTGNLVTWYVAMHKLTLPCSRLFLSIMTIIIYLTNVFLIPRQLFQAVILFSNCLNLPPSGMTKL